MMHIEPTIKGAGSMLKRKAYDDIRRWKQQKTTQALLVMGARQVGKTTTIREFGRAHYEAVVEVNFFQNETAVRTVDAAVDAADLLLRLSALSRTEMVEGSTLIFLDEVQECADVLTLVKFLVEGTSHDVILSGSLLGLDAFPARSLPVGYLQTLEMFPLDFEEFCWARSVPQAVIARARESFKQLESVPDYIHEMLMGELYVYLLAGGMPDAVQALVSSDDLVKTRNSQRAIVDLYEHDIVKYVHDKTEARQIEMVYEAIPGQLNATNKRFKYTRLGKNLRFANLETAFGWLASAGIALEAMRVAEPTFPLMGAADRNAFKLYMNDVGLLTSQLMGDVDLEILNRRSSMNFGSIFENVAAQELRAHGFELFYYNSRNVGEIDFVLQDARGNIALCEIKSGKDYRRHSALSNLLKAKNYGIASAFVFCEGNVQKVGAITYLPAYMMGFLERSAGFAR